MNLRIAMLLGALLGATGVGIGAYHAHGLERRLEKQGVEKAAIKIRLAQGEVGVRYQLVHAVALLFVGLASDRRPSRWLSASGWCLLFGVTLFSGGLYMLSMGGVLGHWAIIPLGGLALIAGWCFLIGHAVRFKA